MINKKKENKISKWYELAETKKSLIFIHILFSTLRVVGLITSPIFAARVTVALMSADYGSAFLNLAIELAIVVCMLVSHDQVYRNATRIFKTTYMNVQNKIYKKAYRAKTSNFKNTSKEKLLNIIGTDIDVVCNFGDTLGVRISRAFQMLVTLVIVFSTNWLVGLAILAVSVINFFVLLRLNKTIAKHKRHMYESKDKIYERFTQILSNQDLIKQYDIGPDFASNYFDKCNKYTENFSKHKISTSIKDNFFVAFYKAMIFCITCLMILLVQNNTLSLELYLIIVPYLLTSVELINELINITSTIEETAVSTNRINTVLNFTDEDFISYGNINRTETTSRLMLMNISYENNDTESVHYGKLSEINMHFEANKINIIKGKQGCGKRLIYQLISRQIEQDKGVILLNDINLLNYSKNTYHSYIFNSSGKTKFLNDSIINNFKFATNYRDKIDEICKMLNIYDYINNLEEKFDTNIYSPTISAEKFFLLGLAMALMRDSKILTIYEFPSSLSAKEIENISKILVQVSNIRTIILFTHSNSFDSVASVIYNMNDGKVVERLSNK